MYIFCIELSPWAHVLKSLVEICVYKAAITREDPSTQDVRRRKYPTGLFQVQQMKISTVFIFIISKNEISQVATSKILEHIRGRTNPHISHIMVFHTRTATNNRRVLCTSLILYIIIIWRIKGIMHILLQECYLFIIFF